MKGRYAKPSLRMGNPVEITISRDMTSSGTSIIEEPNMSKLLHDAVAVTASWPWGHPSMRTRSSPQQRFTPGADELLR